MSLSSPSEASTLATKSVAKGTLPHQTPKILAVDDRSENLVALKAIMKNFDAELIMVTSGAQALSEILRHEFALILMDVQMPEMDGFETASLIREYEPAKNVPLIFVTAINKDQVYMKKGYDLGAIDYLCKPFEPDILQTKVRGFLEMHREKMRLRDVTEQLQQTQQALKGSNQELGQAKTYLENVIGSMAESLIVLDASLMIQAINPATNELLGYDEGELLGKSVSQVIVDEGLFVDGDILAAPESRQRNQELMYRLKNGAQVPVLFSCASMQKTAGEALGFVCLAQDITEQKRTAEELGRARDLALEGMKAKSKFLATMSHEIRTPMNGVIGMAEFLADSELTPEQRDYVDTLKVSGNALLTVINDILDFSKIEAGKMSLETISFSLRKVVDDVMDLIAIQAHPKGLEAVTLLQGQVPFMVDGDPGRLRQVLLNLLGNAVKFTNTGEVSLQVAVVSEAKGKTSLRFEVVDTGIGMSAEVQTRVFAPFAQGDGSTAREYGGTGLGLIISQKLITLMGGEIEFESHVDQGTRMWFTIDVPISSTQSIPSPSLLPSLRTALFLPHRDILSSTEALLRKWGGEVEAVGSGDEIIPALVKAHQEQRDFDILILEVEDMDDFGASFFGQLREAIGLESLRVIIVTAFGKPGDGKRARILGASGYITKPIKQEQLYRGLCLVMGQNQEPGKAASPSLVTRHTIAEHQVQDERRILLAEDNLVNQKVAVRMLQKLGYAVDVAMNGQEAIYSAKGTTTYHAILMDCMMPEVDGYEATLKIREAEELKWESAKVASPDAARLTIPRVPIIAVTANAFDEDKEKCLASGMDDFLPKPIRIEALQSVLEKWVAHSTSHT